MDYIKNMFFRNNNGDEGNGDGQNNNNNNNNDNNNDNNDPYRPPNLPPQRPPRNLHPSQRGGLPQILDMLRAYPSYFFERSDIEKGNKILLPPKILEQITNDHHGNMPYPLCFSISSLRTKITVYVGVLEFLAPENSAVLPFWLFNSLQLNEGEMIRLGLVEYLPKANFARLRPHKTAFIDLPDPRSILEAHLSNFTCLTKNETITVHYNKNEYQLDILEIKPENQYNAAIIIDTDLNIDFAPPLDYVEPPKQYRKKDKEDKPTDEFSVFSGKGLRMDGRKISEKTEEEIRKAEEATEYDPRKHRIPRGIRKEWAIKKRFTGKATVIGD